MDNDKQMDNDSLFGKRIGNRILVCPECAQRSVLTDVGPGRGFCHGQDGAEHREIEMIAFVQEDGQRWLRPA